MAYYLPYLFAAVRNRLRADTGSGGLFQTGATVVSDVYNVRPPVNQDIQTKPYVVFRLNGANPESEGMGTRSRRISMSLYTVVPITPESEYDAVEKASTILWRMEGNWEDQTFGTPPTYGLIRHVLDLGGSTSWVSTILDYESDEWVYDDENLIQHRLDVFGFVSRRRP